MKRIYLDAEPYDGYQRDQSVFGDGISIEDDMSVMAAYDSGATLTYHLTAYSPWEGYRVAFNGDAGRLEYEVHENSYISGSEDDANRADMRETAAVHEPASLPTKVSGGEHQSTSRHCSQLAFEGALLQRLPSASPGTSQKNSDSTRTLEAAFLWVPAHHDGITIE